LEESLRKIYEYSILDCTRLTTLAKADGCGLSIDEARFMRCKNGRAKQRLKYVEIPEIQRKACLV
jgi:hypothetical protein